MYFGNFLVYFDDIKLEFENNSEWGLMEWILWKFEFFLNVFKDFGMKIIDLLM